MALVLQPVTLREACAFIGEHHPVHRMSEARCGTCRFMAETRDGIDFYEYEDETGTEEKTTEHHSCVRIIHGNGNLKYEGFNRIAPEPAIVTDGSGYAARLLVLPTFGCVLHEPSVLRHTEEKREP